MAEAEFKISELVGADPLAGTEVVPLVQNSQTRIRTVASLVAEGGLTDHENAADPHSQYMQEANNLSDVSSVATARTNLDVYSKGESDSNYLNESDNLFDLPDKAVARTNLDVYSKTESDGRYLDEANNLSDLGDASTARTNLDVYSKSEITTDNTAYDNSTSGIPETTARGAIDNLDGRVDTLEGAALPQSISGGGSLSQNTRYYISDSLTYTLPDPSGVAVGGIVELSKAVSESPVIDTFGAEQIVIGSGSVASITLTSGEHQFVWDGSNWQAATSFYANDDRAKTALNASGSAPIYACRAWVNFNGTETVSIREGGNVSSITDNGIGQYTVNFISSMPDINYVLAGTAHESGGVHAVPHVQVMSDQLVNSVKFYTTNYNGDTVDGNIIEITVTR